MKTAIITGSDKKYFYFLKNLVLSLNKSKCLNYADLCIFDVDLKKDQFFFLSKFANKIIKLDWSVQFNFKAEEWKKLLVVRPFIKDYFPGYSNYIWLDADTIVQDHNFLFIFNKICNQNKLGIVSENSDFYTNNRPFGSFKKLFLNYYKARGWVIKNYVKFFGNAIAEKLFNKPLFNAGVFCMSSKSIIWNLWKRTFKKIILESNDEYCLNMDQASLNFVIYNNISELNVLDARFNWLVKNRIPLFDSKKKIYKIPFIPNDKISIIHFTQIDIKKKIRIKNTDDLYINHIFLKK